MQSARVFLVDEGDFQREPLVPGQEVVWTYRPQRPLDKPRPVAAKVVYVCSLRVRIRVRTTSGQTRLRWVHPKNLHARAPDEPAYPYPEPS